MSYYDTCPECGATLDPGEKCDCKEKTPRTAATMQSALTLIATEILKDENPDDLLSQLAFLLSQLRKPVTILPCVSPDYKEEDQ